MSSRILVVDLDHSLIQTDLLDEALIGFLKKNPLGIFRVTRRLLQGRSQLKSFLAAEVILRPDLLPYNAAVLKTIEEARARGDHVVLASASPAPYVEQVAAHLQLFHDWMGSEQENLKGSRKLQALQKKFPNANMSYIGDSRADVPIWKTLGHAYVVGGSAALHGRLTRQGIAVEPLSGPPGGLLKALRKGLRMHQWAKNILVFVPLILSYNFSWTVLLPSLLAFIAFCLTASSIYILNDLLDLEADRQHKTKKFRPFAAGTLSIRKGLMVWLGLVAGATALAAQVNFSFAICLLLYFVMNLGYSFKWKQVHSLDVLLLAGMYTIRIFAGGQAAGIEVSHWLMAFSTFMFLGLAFLKRYGEVLKLKPHQTAAGRGYQADDKLMLGALGAGSSLLSCLVLALYFNSSSVAEIYGRPEVLWLVLPLQLYWTCRIWLLAGRGEVDSDPVLHTLKSRNSYLLGVLTVLILWYAQQG